MHIVVIGNGISGITCARWCRKLGDAKITVISSETKYFYSRTALMYVYMGHMRAEDTKPYEDWFWEKNRIDLLQTHVHKINFKNKTLHLDSKKELTYDKLVLATGSKGNKFGWPGQDLKGVSGLYSWQELEAIESASSNLERAVIVGGGLIGIELAEMFLSRNIDVTMLVREESYWNNVLPPEESSIISRHIKQHHVDLKLGVNLKEIQGDENGNAQSVIVKETNEKISCGFVGLTAGVSPNINFVKDTALDIGRGIKVNNNLETNIQDVYAIGDCAELTQPRPGRRSIEAVWYTGRMMGETVAYNIMGHPREYDPGIWFNSAKFMDIEYQVYGDVPNKIPDHMSTLYWEDKDRMRSIRINYDSKTEVVLGFNLLGIRYRHEVCEKWIADKTPVTEVLQNLTLANFDPEFSKEYEEEILNIYNEQTGKNIRLKKKRKLDQVLAFLSGK